MSDERRGDGSGAVVAIVVILGILGLLGVVVVVGGALFFVSVRSSDVQVMETRVMADMQAATPPVPAPILEPDPNLTPAAAAPSLTIEFAADGKMLLAGSAVTLEELKTQLTDRKRGESELYVSFINVNQANSEALTKVTDLLKEMNIGFEHPTK